jgi:protocatechuate 3,4-dioxygenase beta subunit
LDSRKRRPEAALRYPGAVNTPTDRLQEPEKIEAYAVVTDSSGRYEFHGLAPGWYKILAAVEGETVRSELIEVAAGETVDLVVVIA